MLHRLIAWECALVPGLDVRWLDHAEPIIYNVATGPSVNAPSIGLMGSPFSSHWRLRGHAGVPPQVSRVLRPAERLILMRHMPWDALEPGGPPPALLEMEVTVGATLRAAAHLWADNDGLELVWEDQAKSPRIHVQRMLSWTAFQAVEALGVACPSTLQEWLSSTRTKSFGAFVHRAEGLASRVDSARLQHFTRAAADDPLWPAAQITLATERAAQGDEEALPAAVGALGELHASPWDWLDLAYAAHACRDPRVARRALDLHCATSAGTEESEPASRLRAELT